MSFYMPALYRGVESVSGNWPDVDSSIVMRYGWGPLRLRLHQTVVSHQPGQRVRIHEEVCRGLWMDDLEVEMREAADGTEVTLTTDQRSRFVPLKPLALLRWLLNWLDIPPAIRRFKAMVEQAESMNRRQGHDGVTI